MNLQIDTEFKQLIPELTKEEYELLEKNVIQYGCLNPIIVWNDIIIDGHKRYEIYNKHSIVDFGIKSLEFETREEAKVWIIDNQLGRRNLQDYDRVILVFKRTDLIKEIKAKAKANQGTRTDICQISDKSLESIDTLKEVAKRAGVSRDTASRVKYIEENATEEQKEELSKGKLSINGVYSSLKIDFEKIAKYKEYHEDSMIIRNQLKEKYDGIPDSVWEVKYDESMILDNVQGQNAVWKKEMEEQGIPKEAWKCMAVSGKSVRKNDPMSVSKFPQNIARRAYRFYSEEGDTVYDPCAGHVTRMQVAYEEGRTYIGYDVSKAYMQRNRKVKDILYSLKSIFSPLFTNQIELYERSSENCHLPDNSVDFVFSSVPYWKTEYYGNEPEQAGYNHTYEEFLTIMKRIYSECYRILKPGKFCVINVNFFRKDGKLYLYHQDTTALLKEVGFIPHDEIIMENPHSMRSCFANQIEETKQCGKKHEYLLVMKK